LAADLALDTWAIGGSTLLHHLSIEPNPADLDIVTTVADFAAIKSKLVARFGEGERPQHPRYLTTHFYRVMTPLGASLDLMAGIKVRQAAAVVAGILIPATSRLLLACLGCGRVIG
jgi:hypothetical protein